MSIQVTIKDGHFITLDELVAIVPLSTAAKELKTLRAVRAKMAMSDQCASQQSEQSASITVQCHCGRPAVMYRCLECMSVYVRESLKKQPADTAVEDKSCLTCGLLSTCPKLGEESCSCWGKIPEQPVTAALTCKECTIACIAAGHPFQTPNGCNEHSALPSGADNAVGTPCTWCDNTSEGGCDNCGPGWAYANFRSAQRT